MHTLRILWVIVLFLIPVSNSHPYSSKTVSTNQKTSGTTIIVDTLEAVFATDGYCSFPEAIASASSNQAYDTCPAGNMIYQDQIFFNVSGSIELQNSLPSYQDDTNNGPLTIDGAGKIIIDGQYKYSGLGARGEYNLTIKGLTFTKFDGALGIGEQATVNVYNSSFIDNKGYYPTVNVINGNLSIWNSAFVNNQDPQGGAIYNFEGNVNLYNSTFNNNRATGFYPGDTGGAIYNLSGIINIINSTFKDNYASQGGGIYIQGGVAKIYQSIFSNSEVYAVQSLSGALNYNSIVNTLDLKLGQIGYYGGPTQTIPLFAGSPAINAGTMYACSATDQRGAGRRDACDLGAFEYGGVFPNKAEAKMALSLEQQPPYYTGESITAHFQVEPINGSVNPAGQVVVYVLGSSIECIGVLANQTGTCTFTFDKDGSILLYAMYSGDGNFNPASRFYPQPVAYLPLIKR